MKSEPDVQSIDQKVRFLADNSKKNYEGINENFISRKTIIGLIKILHGKQKILYLGNLYSKRDWVTQKNL